MSFWPYVLWPLCGYMSHHCVHHSSKAPLSYSPTPTTFDLVHFTPYSIFLTPNPDICTTSDTQTFLSECK